MSWLSVLALTAVVAGALGYPGGAPTGACASGRPGGPHGSSEQTGANYAIKTDTQDFQPGKAMTVTLEGQAPFKGFLVRAYDESSKSFGVFTSPDQPAKLITCDHENDTITHQNNQDKAKMVFRWHPPHGANSGFVRFRATVVKTKTEYWMNIQNRSTGSGVHATILSALLMMVAAAYVTK